jgi:hypothetical protein
MLHSVGGKQLGWLAVLLLILGLSSSVRAQEVSEEAKTYFRNGVELLQETPPNYQDAYYQFKLAYEKSNRSWKVLGNLGLCSLKLERDGDAIQYYTEYLDKGARDIPDEERKPIERDLLLLKGNMATVEVSSTVSDLEVTVSRVGSSAPPQVYQLAGGKGALSLRAGTQVVTARSGGRELKWEVVISPGQSKSHEFTFEDTAAPVTGPTPTQPTTAAQPTGTQAPPPAEEPAASKGSPLRTVGFITAGVGLATLGAGGVFGLMANSAEKDAKTKAETTCVDPNTGMPPGNICPASVGADYDSAKSKATLANVLMIAGGALTATGVVLVIVGGKKSTAEQPPTARLELVPAMGPGFAGVGAVGAF